MNHWTTRVYRIAIATALTINLFASDAIYGADVKIGAAQPASINLQQLPSLIDIPQTPETIEKELKLEEEGENLFRQHLLDKALAKWQEAYGLSLEMKYAEGEGRALTNMARIFLERGQFVKAKYMGENAIEVLNGVSDKKALGRAHLFLAQAYFGLDNPVWAGEQLDYAMKAFGADGGNNSADTARLMSIAAGVILKMGKIKEALQFLQAAAMYYSQSGDNTGAIASRVQVVDSLLALGLLTAAQEEAEKAVSVARTAPDQEGNLALSLSCLANCKFALGETIEARKLYEQVLTYAKKLTSDQMSNMGKAGVYLGYGTTIAALGDYEKAKQALEFALPVFKAAGASLPQAQTSNTLGIIEWNLGHHEHARELLEQALDLHNLIVPKQDAFRVTVLQNLASVESRLGHNREASAHLQTAVQQLRKVKESTLLGRSNVALAEIALKLAEEGSAEKLLDEALQLSQAVNDDSALWREYTLLAKIQLNQGNTKVAHESLQSAISFFRSPQAGDFASPEHIQYPSERHEMAYQLVYLLVQEKMFDQALLVAEQLKEEEFLRSWQCREGQIRSADSELYKDLSTQRAHLHAAEVSSSPNKILKSWQEWLVRFRSLSGQKGSIARLVAPVPLSISELTKNLQANHLTVFNYLLGVESSILFTISSSGNVQATILNVGGKQLTSQINSLLAAFGRNNIGDDALSGRLLRSLYAELFPESTRERLPSSPDEVLVIVPDGVMANVPFAALINQQNKFLIGNYTISLTSSLASILDKFNHNAGNTSFLFVISNLLESEEAQEQKQELKFIAQNLPPSTVSYLKGSDATLANLQEQSADKLAVQIAGNIELNANNGLDTALPFKLKKADEQGDKCKVLSLFSSSLSCDTVVLDGAQVGKIVQTDETGAMPSSVVADAFHYAGVHDILISLWRQSGNIQGEELKEFYMNQLAGGGTAAALRKAQLSMLARHPHPADWAPLQLFSSGY